MIAKIAKPLIASDSPCKPRTYDIVTEYEPHYGWIATDDKTYDGPPCPIGHGATKEEAIADLIMQLEE